MFKNSNKKFFKIFVFYTGVTRPDEIQEHNENRLWNFITRKSFVFHMLIFSEIISVEFSFKLKNILGFSSWWLLKIEWCMLEPFHFLGFVGMRLMSPSVQPHLSKECGFDSHFNPENFSSRKSIDCATGRCMSIV